MPFDTLALVCFSVFLAALIVLVNAHRVRAYSARVLLRVGCAAVMLVGVIGLVVDSVPPPLVPVNVPANVPASLSILATAKTSQPNSGFVVEGLRGTDGSVRWLTPLPAGDWQTTFDGNTLYAVPAGVSDHPTEREVLALDAISWRQVWSATLGSLPSAAPHFWVSAPVIASGALYVTLYDDTGRGIIYALDPSDGHVLWRRDVNDFGSSILAYTADMLDYMTISDSPTGSRLVGLRAVDGSVAWRSAPGGYLRALTAGGGIVFAQFQAYVSPGYVLGVAALSATDGSLLWTYGGTAKFSLDGATTLSLGGDQLYVAMSPGSPSAVAAPSQLDALAATTGALLWKTEIGVGGVGQQVVRSGSAVYFPSDTMLYARSTADGGLRWQHTGNANVGYETPVVTPTALFAISRVIHPHDFIACPPTCEPVPALTAFNAATGLIYWRKATSDIAALTLVGASG